MIERLRLYLQDFPNAYPHQLEQRYPRVLDSIVELWDTPRVKDYLAELLLPTRTDRQGFPHDIIKEIVTLLDTWSEIRDRREAEPDVWSLEPEVAVNELENRGLRVNSESFHRSIHSGDLMTCQLFIFAELPVDARDARHWTPLMMSAFDGHQHIAELLINKGAQLNAKDLSGYTPLHWAAFNGYRDIADLLIKKGAFVGAQSNAGITPLLQAAAQGHHKVIERLLQARADPNCQAADGATPLHKAVANGHRDAVLALLRARASVALAHDDGATPLTLAEKGLHPEIRRLVRAAAAASAAD